MYANTQVTTDSLRMAYVHIYIEYLFPITYGHEAGGPPRPSGLSLSVAACYVACLLAVGLHNVLVDHARDCALLTYKVEGRIRESGHFRHCETEQQTQEFQLPVGV